MSRRRTILVTGAQGQLGRALVAELEGSQRVIALSRAALDVSDEDAARRVIPAQRPDVVIHAAALTDVDACERAPDAAHRVNARGTAIVAAAAQDAGARLVYISTDFVFSGRDETPLHEGAPTGPINAYGRSKLAGEGEALARCPDALVCRTAWLYGTGPAGFLHRMLARATPPTTLRVVADQWGNPTWVEDVARQVARLLESDLTGVVHVVSRGGCSRYELIRRACDGLGLAGVTVEPARASEFPTWAPRPRDTRLSSRRLAAPGLNVMPPWEEALEAWIARQ